MSAIKVTEQARRRALTSILGAIGVATLFELLALLATQVHGVRATSPWRDDPFNTAVDVALFLVPVLAVALAARLTAWNASAGVDRIQQMLRVAAAIVALICLAAGFQWAAVLLGAGGAGRSGWSAVLVVGLGLSTLSAAVLGLRLKRELRHRPEDGWREDWLGDAVLVCSRLPLPLFGRIVGPALVDRVRAHALEVFALLSLGGALVVVGGQTVGEGWSDPLLIGWALAVATALFLAACILANELAGFVARPPRSERRRAIEASGVAGCLAAMLAVAFHTELWEALTGGPPGSVSALVALTGGAALLAVAITAIARALDTRGRRTSAGAGAGSSPRRRIR